MGNRTLAGFMTVSLLVLQSLPLPAHAENPMGYRLLSPSEAAALPHNQGSLGLNIERAQQVTDGGMTFDLIRITQVAHRSTSAQAGLSIGDLIIAVNGRVFPSLAAFAAYIGSMPPGSHLSVDYIPAGGGPQQAQRVGVAVGPAGQAPQSSTAVRPADASPSSGMSMGAKVAIGVGAVALLGCYEMGCFSHRSSTEGGTGGRQPQQPNSPRQQP